MKIVRLKAGYRINCTNSEFEVLKMIVTAGLPAREDATAIGRLTGSAKAALRRAPFILPDGPLDQITDDRRGNEI